MLSVVIPTRNRAQLLVAAIDSLAQQTLSQDVFEVLVIDNGSTDETADVVKGKARINTNLRYFYEPEPGLHAGRHRGMLEARGDVLVFADDDIEALPSWLQTYADVFSDPDVAMAGGNNYPMFLETPPPWLEALWSRRERNGGRSLPALSIQESPDGRYSISPYQIWGCNFAIRRTVLLSAGGFHPDGMPRDLIRFRGDGETHVSAFANNKSLKCLFDSNASVYHKVPPERMTLSYFRQRGFNQGVSDSYTRLRSDSFQRASIRSVTLQILISILRRFKYLFVRSKVLRQAHRVLELQRIGYQEGYAFHQAAYREDPEVMAWVHRENYFQK